MTKKRKLEFRVAGRYGYSAVDVFDKKTGEMLTTAIAGVTKKEAEIIAGALANARGKYYDRLAESVEQIRKRQALRKVD